MIRKAQDQKRSSKPQLRGGRDITRMTHFLEESESYGTGRLFAIIIIPPRGSIGCHTHTGEFEIFYILKGVGKVMDNGVEEILHPGDSMTCLDGDNHSIENIGDCDLEFVAIILNTKEKQK